MDECLTLSTSESSPFLDFGCAAEINEQQGSGYGAVSEAVSDPSTLNHFKQNRETPGLC